MDDCACNAEIEANALVILHENLCAFKSSSSNDDIIISYVFMLIHQEFHTALERNPDTPVFASTITDDDEPDTSIVQTLGLILPDIEENEIMTLIARVTDLFKAALLVAGPPQDPPPSSSPSLLSHPHHATQQVDDADDDDDWCPLDDLSRALPNENDWKMEGDVEYLRELMPTLTEPLIQFVYHQLSSCDRAVAARLVLETSLVQLTHRFKTYTMQQQSSLDAAAKQKRQEAQSMEAVLERYGDTQLSTSTQPKASTTRAKQSKKSSESPGGIRYYDNVIVSRKGGRYLKEASKEEWDGGSTGRVKSKGKRGKGYTE